MPSSNKKISTATNVTHDRETADIVIIGGGLAGLSMAAALSSLPVRIVVVESTSSPLSQVLDVKAKIKPNISDTKKHSPSFDDRALALSLASIKILKNIGILNADDVHSFTPIEHIHVSDRGHSGMLRMSAKEVHEDNLGRVVPAPLLGEKLLNFLMSQNFRAKITVIDQATVENVEHHKSSASVLVKHSDGGKRVDSQVVVLADGGRSKIAEMVGLPARKTDYQQIGILANLRAEKAHQNTAYERFTDTGPIALLPLGVQDFKLVWTVKPEEKQHILDMSEQEFLDAVLARFGRRAGKFQKVSQRVSYPMIASERQQIVSGRVALIGNAAHSLHPIAGQGFNLGLRDIASLTEILAQQLVQPADLGDTKALMRYQAFRQRDIQRTAMFTDQLVKQFSTNSLPHAALRNIGLLAVDRLPSLKQHLMRKLMGVTGQQFKLLTGKPLI